MSTRSKIEWTDCTWNPVTGCSKISAGCQNCYAERMALRLRAMGSPNYVDGFAVRCHPHMLERPLHWAKPRMVFVNSMSDLFHPQVPTSFVKDVFAVMRGAHWHTFQVLTKRSGRLLDLDATLSWTPNMWAGVTVETDTYHERIDDLRKTDARVKFLSLEPLLGPFDHLDLMGVDWVIVGGESGPRARPIRTDWVLNIRDQCRKAGVAFFFKQWGGVHKKQTGRLLEGRTWDQFPLTRQIQRQVGRGNDPVEE